MSSKRAMKQAQKQAFAKHRSNITNSRFGTKKKNFTKNKKKNQLSFSNFSTFLHVEIFEIPSSSFKTVFIKISCLPFLNKIWV